MIIAINISAKYVIGQKKNFFFETYVNISMNIDIFNIWPARAKNSSKKYIHAECHTAKVYFSFWWIYLQLKRDLESQSVMKKNYTKRTEIRNERRRKIEKKITCLRTLGMLRFNRIGCSVNSKSFQEKLMIPLPISVGWPEKSKTFSRISKHQSLRIWKPT